MLPPSRARRRAIAGFTLIEMIAAIAIIGILAALLSAGWLHFNELQKLKAGQAEIYRAFQAARNNAIRDKDTWQVSISEQLDREPCHLVRFALHKAEAIGTTPGHDSLNWQQLDPGVCLDTETTLPKKDFPDSSSNIYHYLLFNYTGCPASVNPPHECLGAPPGRVTLAIARQQEPPAPQKMRRCVIISTILGAMRMSKEQPKADSDGHYCY